MAAVGINSAFPETTADAQQAIASVEPVGQVAEMDMGAFWLTVRVLPPATTGLPGVGFTVYETEETDPVRPLRLVQTAV